jgi:Protein of unknown function (DUF2510)
VYVHAGGGHSWIAVAVLVAVLGLRMFSMRRRRQGGRPRSAQGARSLTSERPPTSRTAPTAVATDVAPATEVGFTGTAPGWFVDPFVRHEQRYWSGTAWTEHVTDDGSPSVDPPPGSPSGN